MWESPHDRPSSGLPYTPGATEARAPRGRRIAADFVPFDAAVLAAVLALVDAIITEVVGTTAKVTRTAAVVAALRVAVT